MNLTHETSFAVFPGDCNYHYPMVFGGKMLAEMDRCAATTVRRFLYDSPTGAKHALTVGVDKVVFHKGAEVGDLIFLTGTVKEVGQKRVSVWVRAEKEGHEIRTEKWTDGYGGTYLDKRPYVVRTVMSEGMFHFCAYDMNLKQGMKHGINLERYEKSLNSWECDSKDSPDGFCEDDGNNNCKYCNDHMDERK